MRIKQAIENGAYIVVPVYQGKRGHPVGFSSLFRQALLSLQGDVGAREILRQHADEITYLECDDPGVLFDVDVPEDLPPRWSNMHHSLGVQYTNKKTM